MAPTSIAEAEDLDLDGQGQGDDGELRRPLGEWLTVRADIGDAAPIVPELTAEPEPPAHVSPDYEPADARGTRRRALSRGVVELVVGIVVLVLGHAVSVRLSTVGAAAQAAESGEVVVSSHPSGAAVHLRGVEQGTTPLVLRLATGRHRLEIEDAVGAVQRVDTEVVAGRSVSHHVELRPPAPTSGDTLLIVDTGDAVARLSIDGTPAGATPLASTRVTPGRHTVQVSYRGGVTVEREVTVPEGQTVSLVLDQPVVLDRPPVLDQPRVPDQRRVRDEPRSRPSPTTEPTSGWVRVNAPFQVQVFERGQLVASSSAEQIPLGTGPHTLELVNETLGFRASVTTHVSAGKVADVVVDTPRMPVAINAQPWAEVMVDGRAHGDTPIANLMLPVGEHRVVLRHPDLGERVQMVTVRAAGVTRVSVDLRR